MLLGAILASLVFSLPVRGDEDVNIIIVNPNDSISEVLHRDPTLAPVLCTLTEASLNVTFFLDQGFISVEIENQTTGEYTQTLVNTADGSAIFPFSGNPGFWTIIFSLSDGTVYYGEFSIV